MARVCRPNFRLVVRAELEPGSNGFKVRCPGLSPPIIIHICAHSGHYLFFHWLRAHSIKGLRHEDFAVLGHFVLKSFLIAFTHTQNAPVKL